VEPTTLLQAVCRTFAHPKPEPRAGTKLIELEAYLQQHRDRVLVIFPECTTSNGRGILPLSPCLLSAPPKTKVFPVNLRYTAPDITTPVPHGYLTFIWNLCSKPTHCIRIRIAEAVYNTSKKIQEGMSTRATSRSLSADVLASDGGVSDAETLVGTEDNEAVLTKEERAFLDKITEALARLGRVKRVGLGVKDKIDFVAMWTRSKRR
jgi:1-acylglycerol-3-phosphate O-acyltransferase